MRVRVDGMAWMDKSALRPIDIANIKRELTIVPRKARGYSGDDDILPEPIECFHETDVALGIPRSHFFATASREHDVEWCYSSGNPMSDFESSMRQEGKYAEQGEALQVLMDHFGAHENADNVNDRGSAMGAILRGATGFGKCLGPGTPVLMSDGTIKAVEEIGVGESVMGPDSIPRLVTSTTSGYGQLYRVVPVKGESWVCNDVHVLTLVSNNGQVVDVPLNEYLLWNKTKKHTHKLYQPESVEFANTCSLPVDPYFFGVWVGDGDKNLTGVRVTTVDSEILECLHNTANDWGLIVTTTHQDDRAPNYRIVGDGSENKLLCAMRNLWEKERIPREYLTSERTHRMSLLAGLLDSDGHLAARGSTFEITQKRKGLARDIEFLARSLGYRVTSRVKSVNGTDYHRLMISGDTSLIPTRIDRKKAAPRKQIKNHLRTGFKLEPIGTGEYFGFTLGGSDGRFLLGDFTVTHNTNTALELARRLGRTTLIVVHKEFLFTQWIKRIKMFMPDARVGTVREKTCDYEDKDFVIAMAQSLALEDGKRYPSELYSWPGLLVLDEVHRVGAATWAPIPSMFKSKYMLGLTATPRRKDGADKVFWWNFGEIVFAAKSQTPIPFVKVVRGGAKGPEIMYRNEVSPSVFDNHLVKLKRRNEKIVSEVMKVLEADSGRKPLVISNRLEHLSKLSKMIQEAAKKREIEVTVGYYTGEWFTGEKTLSLAKTRKLGDDRARAIESIYRAFRRVRPPDVDVIFELDDEDDKYTSGLKNKPKQTNLWGGRCARMSSRIATDENGDEIEVPLHQIRLHYSRHGFAIRTLEDLKDEQLCRLAQDYGVAQDKSVPIKKKQTEEQLEEAERARVVFATYQMCSEGVDIPSLDTMIMASPISDCEQAVGRIRRYCITKENGGEMGEGDCQRLCPWRAGECSQKPVPIVVDVEDPEFHVTSKRFKRRLNFYESIGSKVVSGN